MFQSLKRLEIVNLLHTLIITNETETLLRIFISFPPAQICLLSQETVSCSEAFSQRCRLCDLQSGGQSFVNRLEGQPLYVHLRDVFPLSLSRKKKNSFMPVDGLIPEDEDRAV